MMSTFRTAIFGVFLSAALMASGQTNRPTVRVAVVELSHDHAFGFFPRLRGRMDVELAAVVETNHTQNLKVTDKIEKGEAVIEPGAPKNYPDAKKLVTEDCIQL